MDVDPQAGPLPQRHNCGGAWRGSAPTVESSVRDIASLRRFEVFLFVAIATVLTVRAFLDITGYPKVGGGGLHVAHVLWGGLLLGVAVVVAAISLGSRGRTTGAFIGGIGFGLFIDEIGKFLTTNVNYFYHPAVAIIYIVFVLAYLVVRQVLLRRPLTDARRLALVATAVGDQALGQLDVRNRDVALAMLAGVAVPSPTNDSLRLILTSDPVVTRQRRAWLSVQQERARNAIRWLATNRFVQLLALAFLIWRIIHRTHLFYDYLQATLFIARNSPDGVPFRFWYEPIANLTCAGLAGVGVVLVLLPRTRPWGLWVLNWALLLDVLFNQFSDFELSQFGALIGFSIEIALLWGIRHLLRLSRTGRGGQPTFGRRRGAGQAQAAFA